MILAVFMLNEANKIKKEHYLMRQDNTIYKPCPETLDWVAGLWSHGTYVWTLSGYGHIK